jgi:hypothetical protein
VKIGIANPVEIDAIWPVIAPGLQRACNKTGNGTSPGELWHMARSGNGFLVLILDGDEVLSASIWRFENWADSSVFRCMALTGKDMPKWVGILFDFAKTKMKEGGATRLVAQGVKSWPRVVERYANVQTRVLWQCYEVI